MAGERIVRSTIVGETEKGQRIRVVYEDGTMTVVDRTVSHDMTKKPKVKFPSGTIESLRPLLRHAFGLFTVNEDDAYWDELEQEAPFSPRTACAKLRSAGIDHLTATIALIQSEPRILRELAFREISEDTTQVFISNAAKTILEHYK